VLASFLDDAAHVPGGFASGVAFPRTTDETAALVRRARHVLPAGAQSSLTGGATPRGDLVLSTRAMDQIGPTVRDTIRTGAGVPLASLQRVLAGVGLYYPPVPTYDGAFVGGTIATNAAGAATFKYGSTRDWVQALTVVLADGSLLRLSRGAVTASPEGWFEIEQLSGEVVRVPVPGYPMPVVPKLSAGYYARAGMDLVDLFIGSEGTLGVVVDATLRVIPAPKRCAALVRCTSDAQVVATSAALREEALAARRGEGPLDITAIEYMDARALAIVSDEDFARAHVRRPERDDALLLLQFEVPADAESAFGRLASVLEVCGVGSDPQLALPGDERGAARLFELREAVPSSLNRHIGLLKSRVHEDIQKTAGDMIVPFTRLADSLALYRRVFERHGLDYAIWGHVSDGNLHPNVVPRTLDDVERGQAAILEIGRAVVEMGGAPLAEHGVGRSPLKQRLLRELYGDDGIADMRRIKKVLDPEWKLSSGVIFPPWDN